MYSNMVDFRRALGAPAASATEEENEVQTRCVETAPPEMIMSGQSLFFFTRAQRVLSFHLM